MRRGSFLRNQLYYGDNLDVLRESIATESVDLVYLDPPFNSQATYNVYRTVSWREGSAGLLCSRFAAVRVRYIYATQGDMVGQRPTSAFCRRNMEIIQHLFSLLAADDPAIERIFFSWIRERSFEQLRTDLEA
jgi:hypothetical protein